MSSAARDGAAASAMIRRMNAMPMTLRSPCSESAVRAGRAAGLPARGRTPRRGVRRAAMRRCRPRRRGACRGDARASATAPPPAPMATGRGGSGRLLLAAPPCAGRRRGAAGRTRLAALARLGSGPRAALLLRLVAGLHEAEAAAVLGVAPADAIGWRCSARCPRMPTAARSGRAGRHSREATAAARSGGCLRSA